MLIDYEYQIQLYKISSSCTCDGVWFNLLLDAPYRRSFGGNFLHIGSACGDDGDSIKFYTAGSLALDADKNKHLLHDVAANAGAPITLRRGSCHEYAHQHVYRHAQSCALRR